MKWPTLGRGADRVREIEDPLAIIRLSDEGSTQPKINVMPQRPKLVVPSEVTKHIAALLERELIQWPDVSVRPMFGMHAVYHGAAIFAALPDKRAMGSPRAIAYKLPPAARSKRDKTWQVFEVESTRDISRVLKLLGQAYRKAAASKLRG